MKRLVGFLLLSRIFFLCALGIQPKLPTTIEGYCRQYPYSTQPFTLSLRILVNTKPPDSEFSRKLFEARYKELHNKFNELMGYMRIPKEESERLWLQLLKENRLPQDYRVSPIAAATIIGTAIAPVAKMDHEAFLLETKRKLLEAKGKLLETKRKLAGALVADFKLDGNLQFPTTTFEHIIGGVPAEIEGLKRLLGGDAAFKAVGAKKPASILFYGPPGTGKTMLAKAFAGELEAPLLYLAGSEFIHLYVGVGAAAVRNLFNAAKALTKHFPNVIIFIDEIDAIGGKRGSGTTEGTTESDRTIAQLMTCLDGAHESSEMEAVTLFASTNREDSLDDALMRSKRFDEKIKIPLPNQEKRLAILRYYLKSRSRLMEKDVNEELLQKIAGQTENFNCADLDTLVNQAALSAAYERRIIMQEDFYKALSKIAESKHDDAPPSTMYS